MPLTGHAQESSARGERFRLRLPMTDANKNATPSTFTVRSSSVSLPSTKLLLQCLVKNLANTHPSLERVFALSYLDQDALFVVASNHYKVAAVDDRIFDLSRKLRDVLE